MFFKIYEIIRNFFCAKTSKLSKKLYFKKHNVVITSIEFYLLTYAKAIHIWNKIQNIGNDWNGGWLYMNLEGQGHKMCSISGFTLKESVTAFQMRPWVICAWLKGRGHEMGYGQLNSQTIYLSNLLLKKISNYIQVL